MVQSVKTNENESAVFFDSASVQAAAKVAQKLNSPMEAAALEQANQELANQLSKVWGESGDAGVRRAVDAIRAQLMSVESPYWVVPGANLSSGERTLILKDTRSGKELRQTVVEPEANRYVIEIARLLSVHRSDVETIQAELESRLRFIWQRNGEEGVDLALERLCKELENGTGPYRLHVAKNDAGSRKLILVDIRLGRVHMRTLNSFVTTTHCGGSALLPLKAMRQSYQNRLHY